MTKSATILTRTLLMSLSLISMPAAAQDDAATQDMNAGSNYLRLPTGNPDDAAIVDNSIGSPDTSASGVRYVSGGISEEGRDGFLARHQGEGFNTKLMFTGPNGNYLADVDVRITDAKKNDVLTARTDGPILLADLPKGSYVVHASYNGTERTARLNVGGKGMANAAFRFPNGE